MSKLYTMNRMRYGAEAGDIFSSGLKIGGGILKGVAGLFKSKGARAAASAARAALKNPMVQTGLMIGGAEVAGALMAPRRGGASGGWTGRRRKGITATELRGFRKVAKLLHNEGMVIKKKRSH